MVADAAHGEDSHHQPQSSSASSPPNPLNAFIGATQTMQPGATAYYVLTADVGNYTLGGQSDPLADVFSLNPAVFASGGLILANLFEENGDINSTAQSGALFFNGPNSGPFSITPVPGPIVNDICHGPDHSSKKRHGQR